MLFDSTFGQVTTIVASFATGYALRARGRYLLALLKKSDSSTKDLKFVLVVRTDLRMGAGKVASQCAHAAVSCVNRASETNPSMVTLWEMQGQPKIVLRANEPGEQGLTGLAAKAAQKGITAVIVRDRGLTQVASGSATVLGIGPGSSAVISEFTKTYRLL